MVAVDDRTDAGRDVLAGRRRGAGTGVDVARGGTHIQDGTIGQSVTAKLQGGVGIGVEAQLYLVLLPLRIDGERGTAGNARKGEDVLDLGTRRNVSAAAVGSRVPLLEGVTGTGRIARERQCRFGLGVGRARVGRTAVGVPADGVGKGGPGTGQRSGTLEGAVGRAARPGDLEVGHGRVAARDGGRRTTRVGVGPLVKVEARAAIDGVASRHVKVAAVVGVHRIGVGRLERGCVRGARLEGEGHLGSLPQGVERTARGQVVEGGSSLVTSCRGGILRLGPTEEVITHARGIGHVGDRVRATIENVGRGGHTGTGAAIGAAVGVQGKGDAILLGPLGVELDGGSGLVGLARALGSVPQVIEGHGAGHLRTGAAAIGVLLEEPAAKGVAGLGGSGRERHVGGPLEAALRVVGRAVAGTGSLVIEHGAEARAFGPLRVEGGGGGDVARGAAGVVSGAGVGDLPTGKGVAHDARGGARQRIGRVVGDGSIRRQTSDGSHGACGGIRVKADGGICGPLRIQRDVRGDVADGGTSGISGAGAIGSRIPAREDGAGLAKRIGRNGMAAARSDGCGSRGRTAGRAIAVVGDGKQLRPLGVKSCVGGHAADGGARGIGNGTRCARCPAIKAIAAQGRARARDRIVGAVVSLAGSRNTAGVTCSTRRFVAVISNSVLVGLPHGIERVVAAVGRRARPINISEWDAHSVIGGGSTSALGPTQEGVASLSPARRQRARGSGEIIIGNLLGGARGGTVGVIGHIKGDLDLLSLANELVVIAWVDEI